MQPNSQSAQGHFERETSNPIEGATRLKRTLIVVVGLNVAMCAVEVLVALVSGSVSLFADSVDFLEDASINTLLLIGLGWGRRGRSRLGMALAAIILAPSLATLAMAWHRFYSGTAPEAAPIEVTGMASLVVNAACALLLVRHRAASGSLTKAAFLSARNDTFASLALIVVGVVTIWWRSFWPDLAVGLAIAALNAGAAAEVWEAAREEDRAIEPNLGR